MKPNSISGVFLDADFERLIEIDLPLVTHKETRGFQNKDLTDVGLQYGEFDPIGDIHYGNEDFSKSVMRGYIRYLKDNPNIRIGIMGDIIEYGQGSGFITTDDRVLVDDQIAMFVNDFEPLADRIDFMLWGNHEERYIRKSKSKRLMKSIALELGLKPGKDVYVGKPQRGVFVIFKVGNKRYGAQFRHSKTKARVNQKIQLQRAGSQNVVALIAHGHTHSMSMEPRTFVALEEHGGKVYRVIRRQFLLSTGCFLKQPGYAEASDYPYTDVGSKIVRFYSNEHNIQSYDLTAFYREYQRQDMVDNGENLLERKLKESYESLDTEYNCPDCGSRKNIGWGLKRRRCECGRTFTI